MERTYLYWFCALVCTLLLPSLAHGQLEDLKESTRVQIMIDDKGKVLSVATIDKEK